MHIACIIHLHHPPASSTCIKRLHHPPAFIMVKNTVDDRVAHSEDAAAELRQQVEQLTKFAAERDEIHSQLTAEKDAAMAAEAARIKAEADARVAQVQADAVAEIAKLTSQMAKSSVGSSSIGSAHTHIKAFFANVKDPKKNPAPGKINPRDPYICKALEIKGCITCCLNSWPLDFAKSKRIANLDGMQESITNIMRNMVYKDKSLLDSSELIPRSDIETLVSKISAEDRTAFLDAMSRNRNHIYDGDVLKYGLTYPSKTAVIEAAISSLPANVPSASV